MGVSPSERRSWTTPGAKDAAARTYASVERALSEHPALVKYDYEPFLQGSYANATNIRGDSDVDIVVMLRSTYIPDTSLLDQAQLQNYQRARTAGTVTLTDFRRDVHRALIAYYGSDRVHAKDKCLRVDKRDGYVDADVVPAYQVRRFRSYPAYGEPRYIEGIELRPLSGGRIVNYPKEHISNGQAKNGQCGDRYKPTVRQVKRLANYAAQLGKFQKGTVPGYVLECMVYNVRDSQFVPDDSQRLVDVMVTLHVQSAQDYAAKMKSCDDIHRLFVDDPGGHNQYTAKRVIDAMWDVL